MENVTLKIAKCGIQQPENIADITRYIEKVVRAGYSKYPYSGNTAVEFCVAKDSLILGVKSGSIKIKHYIFNRLFYELEKKFELQFCPVYPEKETFYFLHNKFSKSGTILKNALDIYSFNEGFDPNFSAFTISMFSKRYTVRLIGYKHLFSIGLPHIDAMRKAGIEEFTAEAWDKYNEAFEKVYGMRLMLL